MLKGALVAAGATAVFGPRVVHAISPKSALSEPSGPTLLHLADDLVDCTEIVNNQTMPAAVEAEQAAKESQNHAALVAAQAKAETLLADALKLVDAYNALSQIKKDALEQHADLKAKISLARSQLATLQAKILLLNIALIAFRDGPTEAAKAALDAAMGAVQQAEEILVGTLTLIADICKTVLGVGSDVVKALVDILGGLGGIVVDLVGFLGGLLPWNW